MHVPAYNSSSVVLLTALIPKNCLLPASSLYPPTPALAPTSLAFSLLSAGVYRGAAKLEDVLRVAVHSVAAAAYPGLHEVYLVGFNQKEVHALLSACADEFGTETAAAPQGHQPPATAAASEASPVCRRDDGGETGGSASSEGQAEEAATASPAERPEPPRRDD